MPIISSAPKPQSLVQIEALRQQLLQAAELAVDSSGAIDARKLPPALRDTFTTIGGASIASFSKNLDRALDAIDRADVGGTKGHVFGDSTGKIEDGMLERRSRNIAEDKTTRPILGRIAAMLRRTNFTLDADERQGVESNPAVKAVLTVADAQTSAKSAALAKRHFTGAQVLHRDYTTIAPPDRWTDREHLRGDGYLGGDAGALTGIAAVMVRHADSGKWFSARVNDDGSYRVPVGEATGTLSVWYETKSGEKFLGGNATMWADTKTDGIGMASWRAIPDSMEIWPLVYARTHDPRSAPDAPTSTTGGG